MTTLPLGHLAALLTDSAAGSYGVEAATELLIAHRRWLGRRDFLDACVLANPADDEAPATAFVDWAAIPAFADTAPCSSSEARILRLAAELAGIPTGEALGDLLTGLDETNTRHALNAITHVLGRGGGR